MDPNRDSSSNMDSEQWARTGGEWYLRILRELGHTVDLAIVGQGDNVECYKGLANAWVELPELRAEYTGSVFQILKAMRRANTFATECARVSLPGQQYDSIMCGRSNLVQLAGLLKTRITGLVLVCCPRRISSLSRSL